ncbi:hypothetical protein DFH27DRAFT_526781 [Peziza echinospora]|nr:hypothetical protein DFH27DRAFT_526781 [Peziza echinospora]
MASVQQPPGPAQVPPPPPPPEYTTVPLPPPPPPPGASAPPPHLSPSQARQFLILSLRYVISPKEYASLRKLLKFRAPTSISNAVPPRREFDAVIKEAARNSSADDLEDFDFVPSATRAAVRALVLTKVGLEAFDFVGRLLQRRKGVIVKREVYPRFHSPNSRTAVSIATMLFMHRMLSRFFTTLRSNLLLASAKTFRKRHPKTTRLLTSSLAPSFGASLAGIALAIHPEGERRLGIIVYILAKSLEYAFNLADAKGLVGKRPWWFGSWLFFPLAQAQLLHSFVFDRDCFPDAYGKFIMTYSGDYVTPKPEAYAAKVKWPTTNEVIDGIANIARLRYPPFVSPVLNPTATLPKSLKRIAPITSLAHPITSSLHCALCHPYNPSCAHTYVSALVHQLPRVGKFFAALYIISAIPKWRAFVANPPKALFKLVASILQSSVFITGAITTAWGSLCLAQNVLPRTFLPGGRFYIAGMLGGMWALVQSFGGGARASAMYSMRTAMVNLWKVGVKHGWWRSYKNGDVVIFVLCLGLCNAVWEMGGEKGVNEGWVRKALEIMKGGKRTEEVEKVEGEKKKAQ